MSSKSAIYAEKLKFQVFKWEQSLELDELVLHAWAFREDGQRALLRIINYYEEFYLELPGQGWSPPWVDLVVEALEAAISGGRSDGRGNSSGRGVGNTRGVDIVPEEHASYYYSLPTQYLRIRTTKPKTKGWLLKKIKEPLMIEGLSEPILLRPAEHTISAIRKLQTERGIENCSVVEAIVTESGPYDHISTLKLEYFVNYHEIWPSTLDPTKPPIRPRIGVFDIETYSDNHRAMPEALTVAHEIKMISYAVEDQYGLVDSRRAWVLTTGELRGQASLARLRFPSTIDDDSSGAAVTGQVLVFDTELELIRGFEKLIRETDPDFFCSYNGHSYDIPYLSDRMDSIYNQPFDCLGRLKGVATVIKKPPAWKSSAYGDNEEMWFNFTGRISLDLYKLIKRDHKLLKYTLKFVTEKFLERPKIDLPAAQQFQVYETGTETEWNLLLRYSLRDSVCLLDLFQKFNVWVSSMEMANVARIGIEDLYTRGQQIRMQACVYDKAHHQGYVVNRPDLPEGIEYEGAIVQNPVPGYYEEVITLDFSSLYPSIIIAFNICPSTFLPPGLAYDPDLVFEIPVTNDDGTIDVHRYWKPSVRVGILPQLLKDFLAARAKTKLELKSAKKAGDVVLQTILDSRQQAYKVSANSAYGFLGARNGGLLPLIQGAASVTAMGRDLITQVANYLRERYQAIIRYGDTDSVMVYVPGAPEDLLERRKYATKLAEEITAVINKPPIAIAFENLYERFLVFTKKMYIAVKVDEKGQLLTDDLVYKGVAPARREHSEFVRRTYIQVVDMIMLQRSTRQAIYDYIDEQILAMLRREIPRSDCVMVKGLGSYGADSNYFMKDFAEQEKRRGRPHKAGERVSVLVTRTQPGLIQNDKIGLRLRDPEDPDIDNLAVDSHYYINNNLNGPITRILETMYGAELPKRLEFSRKRRTEMPGSPAELKRGSLRPWIDAWLQEVIMPATLSTNHIDMWCKLLQVKSRVCNEIIAMAGKPRQRPEKMAKKGPRGKKQIEGQLQLVMAPGTVRVGNLVLTISNQPIMLKGRS